MSFKRVGVLALGLLSLVGCSAEDSKVTYPDAQKAFFGLNRECKYAYNSGINDIQRSRAFNECNSSRVSFSKQGVRGWVGNITDISTDQGGDVVSVDISATIDGFEAAFGTVGNRISDVDTGSLITPNHPLFNVLSNMKVGDRVRFSGKFLMHPETDRGVWESSLTERGSMDDPTFKLRFTDIEPYEQVKGGQAESLRGVEVRSQESQGKQDVQEAIQDIAQPGATSSPRVESSASFREGSYEQVREQLVSAGYLPLAAPSEEYSSSVDGDPASCGNSGCSVPWRSATVVACVGVSVNDNLDERQWASHVNEGMCE
ncbi:hypothetical protein FHY18_003423 [Xanthomonas arboricola]|uniref:hypothetical protein n=1 Tax=Xanthomonas sp. 3793 TaxID=3035312 RepID=UPI002167629C|nr:hypothetical protein [Xanthomonas sp. 3793]MCS3747795.1 hypothetical protein [Xanthomonas sp. 3793]